MEELTASAGWELGGPASLERGLEQGGEAEKEGKRGRINMHQPVTSYYTFKIINT